MSNRTPLLRSKRFLPLFVTQSLGAFNDNLYKIAMLTLITYDLSKHLDLNAAILNPLAAGLFILPFALFSATAGQLADKYEKSQQVRWLKTLEVFIMILGGFALYTNNVLLMFVTLFLLGLQSTFFGPIKYSILPEHLKENELIKGNALVETATFIAILVGNIIGGLLVRGDNGIFWTTGLTLLAAITGLIAALNIPKTKRADPTLTVNYNFITATKDLVKRLLSDKKVVPIVMLISWFWFFGSLFLAQLPSYTEAILGGDESILTTLIACFSIGIGLGSMLCSRLLKGNITLKYVPLAALLISAFTLDFYWISTSAALQKTGVLLALGQWVAEPTSWRILIDLTGIAVSSGLYIVPLYTALQTRSKEKERSRMVAANNIVNSGFMVMSAIAAMAVLKLGGGINEVFLLGGLLNFLAVGYLLSKKIDGDVLYKFLANLIPKK